GTVFVDSRAHKTIWDGCVAARVHGATVVRYAHDDPEALERALHRHPQGAPPGLHGRGQLDDRQPAPAGPLRRAGPGQRRPAVRRRRPRVRGGGGAGPGGVQPVRPPRQRVVRHLGQSYEHVVLTGGFSKAYSSLLAFVACPPELKRLLKITAPPYLYSGPSPVASLASVLVGLQVNEARGDELRAILWARTQRILDHLESWGPSP
ncbi:MAG TPA: aminotransferase class I/II-fold pyridoxal phosphate-dependent enzyme, partial [Actinomycetota bacterium]|nr:aminotransferase class I/II-fold pyridoxal phosphate-dependent enzyme [Actinomycetota bacterium]